MKKVEQAIVDFIDSMGYLKDPNVLGIVFYGSYLTGYNNNKSDVDLHIIKANTKELIRGVKVVNGFKFEYFEKPLTDLYLSAENEFNNQNNALVSIIGHGKIIYDKNGIVGALQNYINEKYSAPLSPITDDEAKEMVCILDNRMIRLEKLKDFNDDEFDNLYYLNIEKIRKFYHRLLGCPEVPVEKASRIYNDVEYRKHFGKEVIPEPEFVEIYMRAIKIKGSKEDKMATICELFEYSKRNINLDPNNYRILIRSRNDPNNFNH